MRSLTLYTSALVVCSILALPVPADAAVELTRSHFGTAATDVGTQGYSLRSTLGSPVVGPVFADGYRLAGGFWFPGDIVLDTETSTPPVPRVIMLAQSRPNPMRSRAKIDFGVPAPGEVHLRLFDASGRLVRTLVDASRAAGFYSVSWDGRTTSGAPAAAGAYFYVLETSTGHVTRKLTILP